MSGLKIPPGENTKSLWNLDFGSWVLGNFSTVGEVRAALTTVYVCQAPSIGVSPLHYNITDASGKSIIIEYTVDGLNVYDNNIGVLTNRKYMFRTYDNLQLRSIDLTKLDLTKGGKIIVIPIEGGDEIVDITDQYNK